MEHLPNPYIADPSASKGTAPSWSSEGTSRWWACLPSDTPHETMTVRRISFRSQGVILRGYLFLATRKRVDGRLPPVVILSHGFSATQHMGLLDTARVICERTGCATLTFDHTGFGESDGQRHMMCHWTHTVGYLDAVQYLLQDVSASVDVDRICLWGESLSSRLAIAATAAER